MALSNWDTLAVDQDSEPTNGVYESPKGVRVRIYKNWLYIEDEDAWTEGHPFGEPTIMEVHSGAFRYKDVNITAMRGPQTGVYCVVSTPEYKTDDGEVRGMVGCGVYGYDDTVWVGVTEESKRWFQHQLSSYEMVDNDLLDVELILEAREDLTREQAEEMMEDAKYKEYAWEPHGIRIHEKFREVTLDEALRFNQGDMYFAKKFGAEAQATKPGEAKDTVLSRALDKGL